MSSLHVLLNSALANLQRGSLSLGGNCAQSSLSPINPVGLLETFLGP